tara:strand:+ start:5334 stop:5771 length:438 start_codon:yes stop_codon:yes gene_type:complete
MPLDVQSLVLAELELLLAAVPAFGGLVFEDSVLRVLDAADSELPDHFIVLQPGDTQELERVGHGSVREQTTINITAVTKVRAFAPALRAARLSVKVALAGTKAGLTTEGVQKVAFQSESPLPPGPGRVWAAHVLPLQITYVQSLK